jgi:hypothetical protein
VMAATLVHSASSIMSSMSSTSSNTHTSPINPRLLDWEAAAAAGGEDDRMLEHEKRYLGLSPLHYKSVLSTPPSSTRSTSSDRELRSLLSSGSSVSDRGKRGRSGRCSRDSSPSGGSNDDGGVLNEMDQLLQLIHGGGGCTW